jgi:hopanoid C-3 methylase
VRILLVKPRARLRTILGVQGFQLLEPIELGYIAAAVPRRHEVKVLDLRLARAPERSYVAALRGFRPDLVGFTGYSHEASIVKCLAATVRRELPRAKVVVGGHHATVAPRDYDIESIDAVVRGDGCTPIAAIVTALEAGDVLMGIPGVHVPLVSEPEEGFPHFPDPATLPAPRRDLWDWRRYHSVWAQEGMRDWQPLFPPTAMVRSSFGCKMKCSFCIVPHLFGRHMPRPVDSVVDEIASLPAEHVYFCDDENFIDEAFAWELAEALARRGVRKRYFAWARSTTVNRAPELLKRWREIGLDSAFLGFEFPDDEALRKVAKGATVAANERAHETLRALGIVVHAGFMVRPEHSRSDFARLADYVRRMPPAQCSFTVCTPSPGTADYEAMKPRIWVDNPFDLHDCMHPLTPTTVPLKEFARLYGDQVAAGTAKTPLRHGKHALRPGDIARVVAAEIRYRHAFRTIYRDYPRGLRAR